MSSCHFANVTELELAEMLDKDRTIVAKFLTLEQRTHSCCHRDTDNHPLGGARTIWLSGLAQIGDGARNQEVGCPTSCGDRKTVGSLFMVKQRKSRLAQWKALLSTKEPRKVGLPKSDWFPFMHVDLPSECPFFREVNNK